jgi:alkaline phosphatase D
MAAAKALAHGAARRGPGVSRRRFLAGAVGVAGCALAVSTEIARAAAAQPIGTGQTAPRFAPARLTVPYGVQSGDVTQDSAVIWSASDRPARMLVEYATTDRFPDARRVVGDAALPETGLTAKTVLTELPAGQDLFYRVTFQDLSDLATYSPPVVGRFKTVPTDARDVTFVWSGDTAGQGWGINPGWGGMRLYEVMRQTGPDFFVHSGDMIYADGPLKAEEPLPDGTIWRNIVTEAKSKVAETIDEYRGNYAYNLLDENVRAFNTEVAQYVQWDDHEVTNNWFHERILTDSRYTETNVALLAARARRAMLEYTPIGWYPGETLRVYRAMNRGPHLDLFMLDMRQYRGPNGPNTQIELTDDARILGRAQADWLKRQLMTSRATWKVIAADMPLGLIVYHDFANRSGSEAVAQGDGPPLGRELEIADILRFIADNNIRNVIWITADVHYCATHLYSPDRAQFQQFQPFYEFVSGPVHAGGFGPNELDNTFGPEVIFSKVPPEGRQNTAPSEGIAFFGHVKIDGRTGEMVVGHRDLSGAALHETRLQPES